MAPWTRRVCGMTIGVALVVLFTLSGSGDSAGSMFEQAHAAWLGRPPRSGDSAGEVGVPASAADDPSVAAAPPNGDSVVIRASPAAAPTSNAAAAASAADAGGDDVTLPPTPAADLSKDDVRRDGDELQTMPELEFANGTRPILLWRRRKGVESVGAGLRRPSHVRMACMYAGFLRNWEWMIAACRDMQTARFCNFPTCVKLFGNQRRHLLESTNCDVYISTWELKGVGRFSSFQYDPSKRIDFGRVFRVFGKWLYALHVQNYSHYGPIWEKMHVYARSFPQSRAAAVLGIGDPKNARWQGKPETRRYLRRNDYSQSYKHWCVLRLVQTSHVKYEVYFRLRMDLRMTRLMTPPKRVTAETRALVPAGSSHAFCLIRPNGTYSWHGFGEHVMHVNNFDVGDFGFMGVPEMIKELSLRPWLYCLAEPDSKVKPVARVTHNMIAEYNLMLWRVIFEEKWAVDSGMRYLWVSRDRKRCKQKRPKPGQRNFGKPLPPVVNFSVATWSAKDDGD